MSTTTTNQEHAINMPVDSPKRLTMEQALPLCRLVKTFRPEWDRAAVLRKMQATALYSSLESHEVVAFFVNAAASGNQFANIQFPGEAA